MQAPHCNQTNKVLKVDKKHLSKLSTSPKLPPLAEEPDIFYTSRKNSRKFYF